MIRVRNLQVIALIYALVTIVSGCGHPPNQPKAIGFTADVVRADLYGDHQTQSDTEKLYFKNHMIRQDIISHGRTIQINIGRRDTGTYWVIKPVSKEYTQRDSVYGYLIEDPSNIENMKKQANVQKLGNETINGYACQKIRYVWHNKDKGTTTLWIAKKLNYPVKTLLETHQGHGSSIELQNIKEQAPPDTVFELPHGYQKIPLPENAAPTEQP